MEKIWDFFFAQHPIFLIEPHSSEQNFLFCVKKKRVFCFVRACPALWGFCQGGMGEVVFWWVFSALWQEGKQLGEGSGHWGSISGGSQCSGWQGHLRGFTFSMLSSLSSQNCPDEKCSSGNLTFSFLVTRSLGETINFYQNCYFLEKRSLLFKKDDLFLFVFIGWFCCLVFPWGECKKPICFKEWISLL